MVSDYELLGVELGASEEEIRRAYFREVRKHSPEKDPEGFQKIRRAYEHIRVRRDPEEGPVLPLPEDPTAKATLEVILNLSRSENEEAYRDEAEKAIRKYPQEQVFLYHDVIALRRCGNTGKSVKAAEKLVGVDPENKFYHRELAISYLERGYTKKAIPAFQKAYDMGVRDTDFVVSYVQQLRREGYWQDFLEIGMALVRENRTWNDEQFEDIAEIYRNLMDDLGHVSTQYGLEVLNSLSSFLLQNVNMHPDSVCEVVSRLSVRSSMDWKDQLRKTAWQIMEALSARITNPKAASRLKTMRYSAEKNCAIKDYHLEEQLKRVIVGYLTQNIDPKEEYKSIAGEMFGLFDLMSNTGMFEENPEETEFNILDGALCCLMELPETRKSLDRVQREYPLAYEAGKDFFERVKSDEGAEALRKEMLTKHRSMVFKFEGSGFYELYPEERAKLYGQNDAKKHPQKKKKFGPDRHEVSQLAKALSKIFGSSWDDDDDDWDDDDEYWDDDEDWDDDDWDDEDDEDWEDDDEEDWPVLKPVVHEKPKIGRNSPCPCGSGKKFKQCCLGKGIYD
ncbi:MAG: SEC-C domain-containing protein [Clostridia bacterium]|nr:SEC-C domain-containing protein [Clostridia bacterium]